MIEVLDLVKTYGIRRVRRVLDHVSLTVPKGSVLGVLGPAGAGKTTLLRILASTLRPTSGTVQIGEYTLPQDARKVRYILALVPDRGYFASWNTAQEYLRFWSRVAGLPWSEARERIAEIMTLLGLEDPEELPLQGITIDVERRLKLAQALLANPEVLLLDEPLTGLVAASQANVVRSLAGLRSQGKTILMTSPHLRDVRVACDHVAILEEGRILRVLKTPDLLARLGRGRHARIFVETDSPAAILDAVRSLGGVVDARTGMGVAVLYVTPGAVDVGKVKEALERRGVKAKAIREAEITLGDVFRALHEGEGS